MKSSAAWLLLFVVLAFVAGVTLIGACFSPVVWLGKGCCSFRRQHLAMGVA